MSSDPFETMKQAQREMWATFAPTATFTTPVAARLVAFAGIAPGEKLLDVATGTGVVAVTAARAGAHVSGLDLTPELLEVARENARIAGVADIAWTEGDAEQLPYGDASFDVVLSQFGHIFAPRAEKAITEMRRVLRPGGRVAFATWPPEHLTGQFFALVARHAPPPPPGASPPFLWGNPAIVTERLSAGFETPFFSRGVMRFPALSVAHYRVFMERSVGPMQKLVAQLDADALARLRAEYDAMTAGYYDGNQVHMDYLLTRAKAR
jgi:SAM-dependent methyltransferase